MASELKQKVLRSAGWLGAEQVYTQVLSILLTGILARLLSPEAFGLVGMVVVFTAFLELFQEVGLGAAVVQRKEVTDEQLSTVFAVTAGLGAALSLLTFGLAPAVAAFYREPRLTLVARLLGLNFLIGSLVSVHGALLRRALDFRKLVLLRMGVSVFSGGVGIALAVAGFGVYALVLRSLCSNVLTVGTMWLIVPWRPRAWPRLGSIRGLLRFGGNVTGFSILNYIGRNADRLLIGRFLGPAALGIYAFAYNIMLLPLRRVVWVIAQPAFAAMSAVQDDAARVRRGFLQLTRFIAFLSLPAMLGIFVVAPEAVNVVLGEKWRRGIFVIRVLALTGALQSVTSGVGLLFRSRGRPDIQFRFQLFATPAVLGAFALGMRWEIEGVAVCYSLAQALLVPVMCYLGFRLVGLSFWRYMRAIGGPLVAALAMAALVWVYRGLALGLVRMPRAAVLVSEIGLGAVLYPLALRAFSADLFGELFDALETMVPVRLARLMGLRSGEGG